MTRVRTVNASIDDAFARLAAFESTAVWDPGVVRASRVGSDPPQVGTRFRVVAAFAGQQIPMEYRLVCCQAPTLLTFVGRSSSSIATDIIQLEPEGSKTRITWRLELTMLGISRFSEPFLGPLLDRLADKALDGLKADLDSR